MTVQRKCNPALCLALTEPALRVSLCPGDISPPHVSLCHHLGTVEIMLCLSNILQLLKTPLRLEAALNLLAWILILGKQCCFRAQVGWKAIIKTMDRKELWFLLHQGIKLPINKMEYFWSITLIPSSNVIELRAVEFMKDFKSGRYNSWCTDIMLGTLRNGRKNPQSNSG